VNAGLRELAERAGLSFEVTQRTLSRLVVEALAEEERRANQKAMGTAEAEAPQEPARVPVVAAEVVSIGKQREKHAGRHRLRCESCRERFTANRRHARFCSVACRVRACRKRSAG
jgi:hypothetical protein